MNMVKGDLPLECFRVAGAKLGVATVLAIEVASLLRDGPPAIAMLVTVIGAHIGTI